MGNLCCKANASAARPSASASGRAVHGTDQDLYYGCTTRELRRSVDAMRNDERFLMTDLLVGALVPKSAAEASVLREKLEAAGNDYASPWKCLAYRVLTDAAIVWGPDSAPAGAPDTPLYKLVGKYVNGYDGLEVRVRHRV